HDLDVTTTEIASRADESDQSRKKLVELSREFRRNTTEDVRKIVAPILKSFQGEIDSLSKRSKAAEKAFLEIYRHLSELPDPVPALEYAQSLQRRSEKVSDLEVENQKLRETLAEYNNEFADVKNQDRNVTVEVTIKQLREKIKDLEDKTESTIQQRVKDKDKELQRIYGEKERQLQNQQFDLVTKYADMEVRQKQLQTALDHAHQEMFEYKSKQEDATSARSSEIDILNQELERANERATNSERLVDKLREQLEQAHNLMTSTSTNKTSDESILQEGIERSLREKLELELASKEREIAALVIDTQKLQSTLIKVKETSVTQISDLENVLSSKEKLIAQLEGKLHSQADYDEIKRELTDRSTDDQPKKSLEILLLEKNRALQSEQTQMKVAHADLESKNNHHSCRHCSSPCSHQTNTLSILPSPLSPSQLPLKPSFQSTNSNQTEETIRSPTNSPSKIISILSSNETLTPSCHSLSVPVDAKYKSCPIMVTPTTQILSSTSTESFPILDQKLSAVQWTTLPCPSTEIKPSLQSPTMNNCLEPLDTTYVANVVRKILAQHNIGQRIFARYVLSLSQGTVSELLSKPKAWAKLTEKGKESYRKMWTWANSEESILALKSISPRKGAKDNTYPTVQQKVLQAVSETQKSPRRSSSSASSTSISRANSPVEQKPFVPSIFFPSFVPSLLMQTTNRLKNEPYPPYDLLCSQPENYRNWLMLQEIVRNNTLLKQVKPSESESDENQDDDEGEEEDVNAIPLDLSMKAETDSSFFNKQSPLKQNKAILPPLNEQDVIKHRHINTMELVQNVKDILSRYSVSQRHFGEKILGLSQGSVSDILARPKQWELLTQKGREPFIRMRLFLDDPTAISLLTHSIPSSSSPIAANDTHANNFISDENSMDSQSDDCSRICSNESLSSTPINGITPKIINKKKTTFSGKNTKDPSRVPPSTKPHMPPYCLPKLPPPTTIDTEQLSSRVRELLSSYSIGQRVFGEAVLNLSQGTVSEILSKPRPWHALSVKGREPYLRMHSWYHDTDNVQKLLAWKQERDVLRRNTRPVTNESFDSESTTTPSSKRRYLFTDDQRRALKQIFENEPYPSQARLEQLVDELSLPMNKISNWFHNARMRTKSNTQSIDLVKTSASPRTDDNNNEDDEEDDDDDDHALSIAPLNNSWFNDSDSARSPINIATNLLSTPDEQKSIPTPPSSKRYHELEKRCREFENANHELKQLNVQLEKDLLSVGGVTELFRRGPEGQPSDSSSNETGIMKDVLNQSSAPTTSFKETYVPPRDSTSDEALTAIVISQRERFRIRNVELENENVSLKQQIGIFQNEMDKLRSDNIKLYEKIKFVQNYPTTRGTDESVDRYSRGYDASLDPFANFTKQEKQRKYDSLKLHEKFALNFGRFILSSHQSRTFFVIYFILVHILIFLSLYKMVHVGSSVRDMSQVCFDKFREHMAGVHGDRDFHFDHAHAPAGAGPGGAPPHR
ncbi:unnamed protein product, partial [Adineta ricciae]